VRILILSSAGLDSASSSAISSARETVHAPRRLTSMPAATFASSTARSTFAPLASIRPTTAATMSPAPVTSTTERGRVGTCLRRPSAVA